MPLNATEFTTVDERARSRNRRRFAGLAAVALLATVIAPAVRAEPPSPAAPPTDEIVGVPGPIHNPHGHGDVITIYHAEGRRSERVIWICEELGIPYRLINVRGDLGATMGTLKQADPVMPMFPNIIYRGHMLVESGAILQFLQEKYGNGRLAPALDSPDYPYHLMWLHYAEGTAMARMTLDRVTKQPMIRHYQPGMRKGPIGFEAVLYFMEQWLGKHPYFGGEHFSIADIMMDQPAHPDLVGLDLDDYPNLKAWRARIEARPAYQRTIAIGEPDGCKDRKLFIVYCKGYPDPAPNPIIDPPK